MLSTMILVLIAPPLLLITLAIKTESPGPVFFRQRRYGLGNKMFTILKFRTMYHELCDDGAELQTSPGDPRVTPLGRWLRRLSLDELPQFINVLMGDMSIIGPRPDALNMAVGGQPYKEIVECYPYRHNVKPGISGLAQIKGCRGCIDTSDKLIERTLYDLYYIEHWSIWFDLMIIAKTPLSLLKHKAY